MLALLEEIRATASEDGDYVGTRELERLRAEAPATGEPFDRLRRRMRLAELELRAGHAEASVAAWTLARELLADLPRPQPRLELSVLYGLALAHMRAGEDANCVARHGRGSCILPIRGDGVHVDQAGSRAAMALFREILARVDEGDPMHLCTEWLLSLAAMTVGEAPPVPSDGGGFLPTLLDPRVEFPHFEDVARRVGLATFDLSGGALVEDFDGDGLPDVVTSTWDPAGGLRFLRNDGRGGFEDQSETAGLAGMLGGLNLVQADYDGDGDVDLLVLRGAWLGERGRIPNSLLANDGSGRFTDVTLEAGLGEARAPTQAAAFGDYDLDGDLDLYVGNESTTQTLFPSQLFRNEGNGTFLDVAAEAGVTNMRFAKGVAWGDYDGDALPDLYVSNLRGWNRLFRNQGDGTFRDVAPELDVLGPFDSFSAWFWDFDNDGRLDLYVSSYPQGSVGAAHDSLRLFPTLASMLGRPSGTQPAALYRGEGKGFRDVAREVGLTTVALTMGANFGDLDNDGFLDFYLGTGYPSFDGLVPNLMYWNRGGRTFSDVTAAGGFGHLQKGHAVVFADLDGDGDQDVLEQLGGAYPGDAFADVLFENPGKGGHWLGVELEGVRSNRKGVGVVLSAEVVEGGVPRRIHRIAGATGSFGGNPLSVHVGLGSATTVRRLDLFWPASGLRQTFRDLAADGAVRITEGVDEVERIARRATPFR